ncbi:MAG: polyprenyl synthetase family protein [Proteobacteria bacterium]|nr:polyprenyl synthetase family protein [Pseudomonadota bacterium]
MLKALAAPEAARLQSFLKEVSTAVDGCLEGWLPPVGNGDAARLFACMRYSTFAGGKRFRPALVVGAYAVCGGNDMPRAYWAGAAMEMIHTYSLMQDDMPCMDNDDLRRGKPTAHKQFDEATAMLASDGLQTGAYELLADARVHPDAAVRVEIIRLFAHSSGATGMVAGQMVDMAWEWNKPSDMDVAKLAQMNRLKTGLNLQACCEAGAVLAGEEGGLVRRAMQTYGDALGKAFQVYDDVLDVTGTAEQLGKTPGKDAAAGKTTFVSLLGVQGATDHAHEEALRATEALADFGDKAEMLRLLARYCVTREN